MRRLGTWAVCGFAVAGFWVLLGLLLGPGVNVGHWLAVTVTAPASMIGRRRPMTFYEFMIVNSAIYAALGLVAEMFRRRPG
jgi:hypothetical protein